MSGRVFRMAVSAAALTVWAQNGPTAEALVEADHFKRALPLVEARLKANANDASAWAVLGQIRLMRNETDQAVAAAGRAVALDANNAGHHQKLAEAYCLSAAKASMLSQMSLALRCKSEFEAALRLDPKHADSLYGMAHFLWRLPEMAGGGKAKAREMAARLRAVNPEMGNLLEGELAALENNLAKRVEYYDQAVRANPHSSRALAAYAIACVAAPGTKLELAEQRAREAIRIDPGQTRPYNALARVLATEEKWNDLAAALAQAEKASPDDLSPYYNAANVLLARNRELGRAEGWLRKYLTQEPEGRAASHGVARWRLGLTLEKVGRKQEALVQLEAAAKAEPDRRDVAADLERVRK